MHAVSNKFFMKKVGNISKKQSIYGSKV